MSNASETISHIIESLPESLQERMIEPIRTLAAEMAEENEWNERFANSKPKLLAAAEAVRKKIESGEAEPFDETRL